MPDKIRFRMVCNKVMSECDRVASGIGTYNEKLMHIILKEYMDADDSHYEVACCGYIADIFDGEKITEIQTGSLSPLKKKIGKLLDAGYRVTVVHPIPARKWISWMDPESGEIVSRRLSPKKGCSYHFLPELVYVLPLLNHENIHFKAVFLDVEEYRKLDGWSKDRKKGSTRCEIIPTDIVDELDLRNRTDYSVFISNSLSDEFSTAEFARSANLTRHRAYAAIRVLKEVGMIEKSSQRGREIFYRRTFERSII